MSLPGLEHVIWRLGNHDDDVRRFRADPTGYLDEFRLDADERMHVRGLDVRRLADLGVHTMLLLAAHRSVHGPQSIGEYMQRMNGGPTPPKE